jgi:hypothetical protein
MLTGKLPAHVFLKRFSCDNSRERRTISGGYLAIISTENVVKYCGTIYIDFSLFFLYVSRFHHTYYFFICLLKIHTVFLEDIIARPVVELEKILTFVGIKVSRDLLVSGIDSFMDSVYDDMKLLYRDDAAAGVWAVIPNEMRHEILYVPDELKRRGFQVLADEMAKTKGLTKWPCESFRELDKEYGTLLPMKSAQLAANCSAAFVKCSVPFDIEGG